MKKLNQKPSTRHSPALKTEFGELYQADCLSFLQVIEAGSIDMIFADPPFNLDKKYPSGINDKIPVQDYVDWMGEWIRECARVLKDGGSFFLWNLPRWNYLAANVLDPLLTFRHWISVEIKYSLPISGRLYPSHYSLLYFCKGKKPKVFHPDRMPMPVCKNCLSDLRDYGGYKDRMNPLGVNLQDVWTDIPPVRHAKYKRRQGANELSLKLLDRIIEMSTDPGDLVFDPFAGSGTTFMAAELKGRRWLGTEIGPPEDVIKRFERIEEEREYLWKIRSQYNKLFPTDVELARRKKGLWTVESEKARKALKVARDSNGLDFGE